jgi:hypothetical protein
MDIFFRKTFSLIAVCKTAHKVVLVSINYALHHEDLWGSGGTAPSFSISALDESSGQFHTPANLRPGKEP